MPDQHSTYVATLRENLINIQDQHLESCKSTFLETLSTTGASAAGLARENAPPGAQMAPPHMQPAALETAPSSIEEVEGGRPRRA